jgi:anti-sigma B factor antagonist
VARLSSSERQLQIRSEREGDTHAVRLIGELDLAGCEATEEALLEAEASDAPRVLIDIDELKFIDSQGLRVLLQAHRRDEEAGAGRLRVTRGHEYVAELLRLTAMDQTLPFD